MTEYTIIQGCEESDFESNKGDLSFVKGYFTLFDYLERYQLIDDQRNISWIVLDEKGRLADPELFIDIDVIENYLQKVASFIELIQTTILNEVRELDEEDDKNSYIDSYLVGLGLDRKKIKKILIFVANSYVKYDFEIYGRALYTDIDKYIYCLANLIKLRQDAQHDAMNFARVLHGSSSASKYKSQLQGAKIDRMILSKLGVVDEKNMFKKGLYNEQYSLDLGNIFDEYFERNIDSHIERIHNMLRKIPKDNYNIDRYDNYNLFMTDNIDRFKKNNPFLNDKDAFKELTMFWKSRKPPSTEPNASNNYNVVRYQNQREFINAVIDIYKTDHPRLSDDRVRSNLIVIWNEKVDSIQESTEEEEEEGNEEEYS